MVVILFQFLILKEKKKKVTTPKIKKQDVEIKKTRKMKRNETKKIKEK